MKKLYKYIGVICCMSLILPGCGKYETAEQEIVNQLEVEVEKEEQEIVLGLSVDQNFESRVGVTDAIKETADDLGYVVVELIADGDAQTQNMQVLEFVEIEVDAILVCAVDQNLIEKSLEVANEAGIPIVAFDRNLPDSGSIDTYVGPDSIEDGAMCATVMLESFEDVQGTIYVLELVGALNDQNGIDRSKGWNEVIATNSNIKVVQMPTDWDVNSATEAIQSAFQAIPEIKAIFCSTDSFVPSCDEILSSLDLNAEVGEEGHVFINGINGSREGYAGLINNEIDGIVVMNLETIGIETVHQAVKLINGEEVDDEILVQSTYYTNEEAEKNSEYIWGAW